MTTSPIWERRWLRWWFANAGKLGLRPEVLAIGSAIVARFGADGVCFPSRTRILRDAGLRDPRTYSRAVSALELAGVLTRTRRRRRAAVYRAGPALLQEVALPASSEDQEAVSPATSSHQDGARDATSRTLEEASHAVQEEASHVGQEEACDAPQNGITERQHQNVSPTHPQGLEAETEILATLHATWSEVAEATGLPNVRDLKRWPESRRKAALARVREEGLAAVLDVLRAPLRSAFLRGEGGRDSWRGATFDWLLRAANFTKVAENQYADRPARSSASSARGPSGRRSGAFDPHVGKNDGLDFGFSQEDLEAYREHPQWDEYLDDCSARFGWGGELGTWPRFITWLAGRGEQLQTDGTDQVNGTPRLRLVALLRAANRAHDTGHAQAAELLLEAAEKLGDPGVDPVELIDELIERLGEIRPFGGLPPVERRAAIKNLYGLEEVM